MNLDISPEDIRVNFKTHQQAISSLHNLGRSNTNEYNSLKQALEALEAQMGWREKYLMGYLGGDSATVQKAEAIKANLQKARNTLVDVDKKLKIENDRLVKEIKGYLREHSGMYQKLSKESEYHVGLYNASATFYNFLMKAKKTVTDALLLTSWDGLLEHPQAKEGLNTFRTLTVEYQREVNVYESNVNVDLLKGAKLEDYIKFSSERVAMDSFNKITSIVKNNISYTDTKSKDTKKSKEVIIEQVKRLIMQSK